jgi:acyl-CoA thioesterase FadM
VFPRNSWTGLGLEQGRVFVVENNAQYLIPVYFNDPAKISLQVTKIGNKSFTLAYKLWINGKEHCSGFSTLVSYNHSMKKSIAIPEKLKDALNQLA